MFTFWKYVAISCLKFIIYFFFFFVIREVKHLLGRFFTLFESQASGSIFTTLIIKPDFSAFSNSFFFLREGNAFHRYVKSYNKMYALISIKSKTREKS